MSRRAFTLIELLIVVAIIAILAAIAVPNFLDAQVRAKVTRAKADMRSIATAVESYWVDNNVGPYNRYYYEGYAVSGWSSAAVWFLGTLRNFAVLTTPVAYMTTNKLEDPFGDRRTNWDGYGAAYPTGRGTIYNSFYFINIDGMKKKWYANYNPTTAQIDSVPQHFANWCLLSIGPDRMYSLPSTGAPMTGGILRYVFPQDDIDFGGTGKFNRFKTWEYDPTNGSNSRGEIIRWAGGSN